MDVGSSAGNLRRVVGTFGVSPGELWGVHQITVDQDGSLYVAEVFQGRFQKFRPRAGADPAKLIGQPVRAAWK